MRRFGGIRRPCALALLAGLALAAPQPVRAQTAPRGIDVSNWQGQIDWLRVGAAGVGFAFAKATEGTTFTDATYPLNRSGAGSVGIRVGAYHFARPAGSSDAAAVASAVAQADAFVAFAQPRRGDLLPVLDLEQTGGLPPARLTTWTSAWLEQVVARLGVRPAIYASPNFWKTALADTPVFALAGHPLWIAHWTKDALPILPGAGWGGSGWTFWQWTNCDRVPGILRCVDGDRFNGADVAAVAIAASPPGPPVATAPPAVVGTPQVGLLLAALPGGWGGGKPASFSYQWQACDAAGAGCSPIPGADGATYRPTVADAGRALTVAVTARAAAGTASAASPPTLAVATAGAPPAAAPRPTAPPTVEGTAQAGQTLSARAGAWSGAPSTFAYQWRRCAADGGACAAIADAGGSTYTLTPDDIGSAISLVVTATGRGGSRSATAAPTATVAPAPLPPPAVGRAPAQPGQAGAVQTADGAAIVTWQPGAVPAQATVALAAAKSRLALPATALSLSVAAAAPLRWPLDLSFASAPADAVPGILPGRGTWQPLAQLPGPSLPPGQDAGSYRDGDGALHVLTRVPGRVALFAPGKWGDPRLVSGRRPILAAAAALRAIRRADGGAVVVGRITLDSQAHLYAAIAAPGEERLLLPQRGSRIGWWLDGRPAKTLQALQLRPGALPLRLRVPARRLRPGRRYAVVVTAVDPYGRRARLVLPLPMTR